MEDVAFEVIAVTDYAEVELGASGNSEVVVLDASTVDPHDCLLVLPNELISQGEVTIESSQEELQEKAAQTSVMMATAAANKQAEPPSCPQRNPPGPHDCPVCKKKFRFASSLIAHRVIHTGERPHRCDACGRCFSFRQSLDRHKQTHRLAHKAFQSLSAGAEHEAAHGEGGVHSCQQCPGMFSSESVLAEHLKSHTAEQRVNQSPEVNHKVIRDVGLVSAPGCRLQPGEVQANSASPEVEGKAGLSPVVENSSASKVTVRTSGRKRRPTMKIQVINRLQRLPSKRQPVNKESRTKLKPVPLNW